MWSEHVYYMLELYTQASVLIMDFLSESEVADHDSGLALFDKPVYTENFQSQTNVVIQPISPPSNSQHASYTFILGSKDDPLYTIPSSVKIFGRLRVCMQNGNPLDKEILAPVPNFPEAIFENIAVSLNGTPIADHGRGYSFKSYVNKNLCIDKATKTSSLLSNYWSDDMGESSLKVDGANLSNGFKERAALIEKSRDVFFIFPPMVDILNTERYLPPRVQLKIDLERGPNNLCLLSPNPDLNFKIEILEINMLARRFTPANKIYLENEKRFLAGGNYIIPFTRSTIRYRTLHAGVLSTCIPSIFTGTLPYHFLVCLLVNEQLCGIDHNPYVFKTHDLKSYMISKNGVSIPQEPVPVGTNDGSFLRSYTHFVENTGSQIFNSSNNIPPDEYLDKTFFIAYDLTPDKCMGSHCHKPETGVIDLHMTFNAPTKTPLTLLILANYESCVSVNKDEVILDYNT